MKYGIISYKRKDVINLGDDIQLLAIKNIYKKMGISWENIKYIEFQELWSYKGEIVILPICFPFFGYHYSRVTCFSPFIIPVFLSISIMDIDLASEDIDYLKRFEPIGCRDEYTRDGLRNLGIKAYLNGCMTLTLPIMRNENLEKNKIYCVDIDKSLFPFLPDEMRENIVEKSHIINVKNWEKTNTTTENIAEETLKEYYTNAKLMITTRLHCAVPCIALGIPTILVNSVNSFRFSWIEKIMKLYLSTDYSNINWNPEIINCEPIKRKMLEYAVFRLKSVYQEEDFNIDPFFIKKKQIKENDYQLMNEIDEYFSIREKNSYYIESLYHPIVYLKEHENILGSMEYAVWGVNQTASLLVKYITANYPNMKLKTVIDTYQKIFFYGVTSESVEEVNNINELFVFVTADAAVRSAKKYFEKIGKKEDSYCMCWDTVGLLDYS